MLGPGSSRVRGGKMGMGLSGKLLTIGEAGGAGKGGADGLKKKQ